MIGGVEKVASAASRDSESPLVTVRNLSVSYEYQGAELCALRGLNLTLHPGSTVGLIGESGSGKTTASKAILKLLPRTAKVQGEIRLNGLDLTGLRERQMRRLRWEKLALVPQAAMNSLNPVASVDQQIAEVIRAHRHVSRADALERARAGLERVGINRNRASAYPHQFSGGMRQRALIAMACVLDPAILVADEPTTGLDVVVQARILDLLVEAKLEFGLSLLVVTHDLAVAAQVCDYIVELKDGEVIREGAPRDLLRNRYRAELRGASDAVPTSAPVALEFSGLEVTHTVGRGLSALRRANEVVALHSIDLRVRRGEIVGLAGESGCGKSTLALTAVGLGRVRTGTVAINGRAMDAASSDTWRLARRDIQLIFQDPYDSLNPRFSVEQAIVDALAAQRTSRKPLSISNVRSRVVKALREVGLEPSKYLSKLPHQLSGGERQRVAIARAIVVDPTVIVADEPVSMLDGSTADQISELLASLARTLNLGLLIISHDMALLRSICDDIAIMYAGSIVEQGPAQSVFNAPMHPYTRALIESVPSIVPQERAESHRLVGEPPSLIGRPEGCAFSPRCPQAVSRCLRDVPVLTPTRHGAACWNPCHKGD